MIRLTDVTYTYGGRFQPALAGLTLNIQPGESVCVMGANGSGKTTFARLVTGLLKPSHGTVIIGNDNSNKNENVGILFQNPDNQMVAVTVEKEIAFALENKCVPQDEMDRKISATLDRFSIPHLRQRLTSELSGGEKQRVALASVMVSEPSILILDEPDSFLDQPGRIALTDELNQLRRADPNMIQVHITQYPSAAQEYNRLLLFDKGKLIADSTPDNIFKDKNLCHQAGLLLSLEDFSNSSIPQVLTKHNGTTPPEVDCIELNDVSFSYPGADKPILKNLTYTFHSNEITCLVGPSGSGKSTLGLMLCGLNSPTNGEIKYSNSDDVLLSNDNVTGSVSAVLQQPERQFFLSTCAEEVAFGPQNLNRPLDEKGIKQFLDMIGLDGDTFSGRDPFHLSGGEKRRLAFAAILSMMPQIVVMDEPTCGLDQEGVGRFVTLARALRERGKGLVIITHDGDLLYALADRILMLDNNGAERTFSRDAFFSDPQLTATVFPCTWSLK
ncbi:MAG: energy-coupling factor transporter ATPase [candidate division Zixibacteria bacterium]|nr:energy-coupling factor transporter ATPase [candidate division Zixibacteria bacterium]